MLSVHIGVDFDNTIICYDDLFHQCAVARGLIPEETPMNKASVRSRLWQMPQGNRLWTELQGEVYGRHIQNARPFPGVLDFFSLCVKLSVRITIVSHKTQFPALGPKVDLREAALRWIKAKCLFPEDAVNDNVFFEDDRDSKISRIRKLKCSHFIDDLPEVFADQAFPENVEKILCSIESRPTGRDDIKMFSSWRDITEYLFVQ